MRVDGSQLIPAVPQQRLCFQPQQPLIRPNWLITLNRRDRRQNADDVKVPTHMWSFSLESYSFTILGQSAEEQLIGIKDIRICTDSTIGNAEQGFIRAGKRQCTDSDDLESGGGEGTSSKPMLLGRLYYKERLSHQKRDQR